MGKIIRNGINYSSTTDAAKNINYDNSASGLAATTAQKAIDELNRKIAAGGGGSSSNIVYLTQAEYDALPEDKLEDNIEYWITDAGVRGSAENVSYDASASGLDAKNVQEAVDKLAEGAGNKVEYLTQEEYDDLPEDKLTNNVEYRILDSGTPTTARNVGYDGTASGIDAVNVQGAIDTLNNSLTFVDISDDYFSTIQSYVTNKSQIYRFGNFIFATYRVSWTDNPINNGTAPPFTFKTKYSPKKEIVFPTISSNLNGSGTLFVKKDGTFICYGDGINSTVNQLNCVAFYELAD